MDDSQVSRKKRWRSPPPDEKHCMIVARMREFSKMRVYTPDDKMCEEFGDYQISNDDFQEYFRITVYPNGYDRRTEGYVSVVFSKCYVFGKETVYRARRTELTGVIAVIDAEGGRRFTKSFVIYRDSIPSAPDLNPNLDVGRYVSRRVLLDEPSEWLPGDTLTLHIDAALKQNYYHPVFHDFDWKFIPEEERPTSCRLLLDSQFARRLAEESGFFRRVPVTPMAERSSGWVRIPKDEYERFETIARILFDGGPVTFDSVDGIFDLYAMADKYDIPVVLDDCRSWLKLYLSVENAAEIMEFANNYADNRLSEIVKVFLSKSEGDGDVDDSNENGKEWILVRREPVGEGPRLEYRLKDEEDIEQKEKDIFDFYA